MLSHEPSESWLLAPTHVFSLPSLVTLPHIPFKTAYSQNILQSHTKLNISFPLVDRNLNGKKIASYSSLRPLQHPGPIPQKMLKECLLKE